MPPPPPAPSPYDGLPSYPGGPQGGYGQQGGYGPQGPYGAGPYQGYGYPQYPGQPQGWYAPERTTNGLAIASLVTAFSCIPFLGLILGIAGLRQIKRRGQQGRGLAVTGVVLNGLATAGLALVVALGVAGLLDDGNTRVENIEAGQCFNTVGHSLSDYGGDGARSTTVDVVPCGDRHDAEAYAVFTLDPGLGDAYPGVDRISRIATDKCASYADDYLGDEPMPDTVDIYYYMPPRDGWDHGDRSVTCFFGGTDGKVTGSVKSGGHAPGVGV